jgi:hypothetical protein
LQRHFEEERLQGELGGAVLGEADLGVDWSFDGSGARRSPHAGSPVPEHVEVLDLARLGRCETHK